MFTFIRHPHRLAFLLPLPLGLLIIFGCGSSPEALDLHRQGIARFEAVDYDRAIALYSEAIRLHPAFVEAYCDRAAAHVVKGEFDAAIADCTQAIRLDPNFATPYALRSGTYRVKGENAEAEADWVKARELGFEPDNGCHGVPRTGQRWAR